MERDKLGSAGKMFSSSKQLVCCTKRQQDQGWNSRKVNEFHASLRDREL